MRRRLAYLYSAYVGGGGLGMCAATTLHDLGSEPFEIDAYGPGQGTWPFATPVPAAAWHTIRTPRASWAGRYTHRRWLHGRNIFLTDREAGRASAQAVAGRGADACYGFSEVALETFAWARGRGIETIVESATGHIRHYRTVSSEEHERWYGGRNVDHPTAPMVARVEEEYALAGAVRVSSEWARDTFVAQGVPADKVRVVPQIIDTARFVPPPQARRRDGPLRICYAGIVSVAKGFPYLFDALHRFGDGRVTLEIAGSTGTREARKLFDLLSRGIDVTMRPQDPVPMYQRSDVLVFPSLHDGFGFVVAEAMACGLPVIVTTSTGASGWVVPGQTGWLVPPADPERIAAALEEVWERRAHLTEMGHAARAAVLQRIAARSSSLPFFRPRAA